MANDTFFTVDEVAQHLNVHADTVRRWIRAGDINARSLVDLRAIAFLNLS